MKNARLAWALAGTIAVLIGTIWMLSAMQSSTPPTDASAARLNEPTASSAHAGNVLMPTAPAVVTAADSGAAPAKADGKSLSVVIKDAFQSANYRQFVHQALAQPTPASIRAAWELSSLCRYLAQTHKVEEVSKFRLPASLQAELDRRNAGCAQAGGPDRQQMRALSSMIERSFDSAGEFLGSRPQNGTLEELSTFHRLGDADGIAAWGLVHSPDHMLLLAGDEPVLLHHPFAPAASAWQAAVCERFTCDDFNARIVRCRDDASCQMSLQDILKESAGVDDATWQQLLEAARRRVKALLPG